MLGLLGAVDVNARSREQGVFLESKIITGDDVMQAVVLEGECGCGGRNLSWRLALA